LRMCQAKEAALRPTAQDLLDVLCPLVEKNTLPPLLELADKTIAGLRQELRQRKHIEKERGRKGERVRARGGERERLRTR
jgi:hypothetical protein